VKRLGGYVLDAALATSILMLLYFRTFRPVDHGPVWSYRWNGVVLTAGLSSIVLICFRLKRYPRFLHCIAYDGDGVRRKTIIVPLMWFVPAVVGAVIALRVVVISIEYVSALK
jgi:hypothetical protein